MEKAPPSEYPQYRSNVPLAYPPPGYNTIQQPQLSPAVTAAAYPPVNPVQYPAGEQLRLLSLISNKYADSMLLLICIQESRIAAPPSPSNKCGI